MYMYISIPVQDYVRQENVWNLNSNTYHSLDIYLICVSTDFQILEGLCRGPEFCPNYTIDYLIDYIIINHKK